MASYNWKNTLSLLCRESVCIRRSNTPPSKRLASAVHLGYQSLEPRKLLATLAGDFADDFNSGVGSNWDYYWNDSGSLTDPNAFEALQPSVNVAASDEIFTPNGSAFPNGSPANNLNLAFEGGAPGAVGHYAIAGFTVEESGYYTIADSFVSLNNSNGDGIEFKVFVDDGSLLNEGAASADSDSISYFDTELGFLAAGSEIFVAFGAGNSDANDAFSTDYSIFRHEEREIIVDVTQGPSATTWQYTVEHSGLYGIRDTTGSTTATNNVLVNAVQISDSLDGSLGYLKKGDSITVDAASDSDFEIVRAVPRAAPDLSFVQDGANHVVIPVSLPQNPADAAGDIAAAISQATQERIQQRSLTDLDGIERSVEVQLAPGTYHLDSSAVDVGTHFLHIGFTDNIVFNGNGATITTDDVLKGIISTSNVKNVVVRDLTIDYAEYSTSSEGNFYKPVGFTQGEVLDVVSDTVVRIEVDTAEFFAPDDTITGTSQPRFLPAGSNSPGRFWGFPVSDAESGRVADNVESIYPTSDATLVEDNGRYKTYDIEISARTLTSDEFSVGDTYVLQRRDTHPAFRLIDSDHVTIQRVTAYSAAGTFVTSRGGELNNILDSHVMIRPDSSLVTSTRVTSSNGDALHVQSDRTGLWVEDSTFNGVSDDVTNFYSLAAAVHDVFSGGNTLVIGELNRGAEVGFSVRSLYEPGDVLVFVDPTEGTVLGEARITAVNDLRDAATPSAKFLVALDQAVAGIIQRGGGNETMVFNTSINKGFVVQDSELTNSRRFGNFLMANNVDLVDNIYSGLPDQAIAGHSELDWPHGPYAKNVLVQGNEFRDTGFSRAATTQPYYQGAVAFFMDRLGDTTATGSVSSVPDGVYEIENIQIRDNIFIDWTERAIVVRNAQRVTIADNQIYAPNETDTNDQSRALLIENSINVVIEDNVFHEELIPILLGDIDLDGEVNFLDIFPFIDLLSSSEFQAEGDINGDGVVSFLDIAPFIAILSSS